MPAAKRPRRSRGSRSYVNQLRHLFLKREARVSVRMPRRMSRMEDRGATQRGVPQP